MAEHPLKGVLSTVGNTPLVELERLVPRFHARIFAKMERFNPGGSIKDRSALSMLPAYQAEVEVVTQSDPASGE